MNRKLHASKEAIKEAFRILGVAVAVGDGILSALELLDRGVSRAPRKYEERHPDDYQYDKQLQHYRDCTRTTADYDAQGKSVQTSYPDSQSA